MLLEADSGGVTGIGDELRFHEYIGDYTLFMTGIFPAYLRRITRRPATPDHILMKIGGLFVPFEDPVSYYIAQGRAAYSKASKLFHPLDPGKATALHELSRRFESYVALMGLIAAYLEADPYFQRAKKIIW
jgi:hypothetical protein